MPCLRARPLRVRPRGASRSPPTRSGLRRPSLLDHLHACGPRYVQLVDQCGSLRCQLRFHNSEEHTGSFITTRGRARMRFSHAAGREDPIGRLRCDFEVGLSPKI